MKIFYLIFWNLIFTASHSLAQTFHLSKNWKYIPIDNVLYKKYGIDKLDDPYEGIKNLLVISENNPSSLVGAEAQSLLALTCYGVQWTFCAYHYALEVVSSFPGSMPSILALNVLKKILENYNYYEKEVENIFSKGGFVEMPEHLMDMASFFVLKSNLRMDFDSWSRRELKNLKPPQFWYYRLQFYKAIDLVKRRKIIQAQEMLIDIVKNTADYPEFRARVSHQLARLKFELRDFNGSEEIYSQLIASPREYGRALTERAWIRYLKKDYAIALGMIHTLKAPSLHQSQHPSQYKLQMIILRELCYFSEVVNVAKEFNAYYDKTFKLIESGQDLTENTELLNLVFQKAPWLPWAELISQIRKERAEVKDKVSTGSNEVQVFLSTYNYAENQLRTQLKVLLKEPLEEVARELLEIREQINLLEYLSNLDKIRPKELSKKVRADEIENFAIEKMYWPQKNEYWRSEMNNIKVLISDKCTGG